jgi:aryl carrier-like protein
LPAAGSAGAGGYRERAGREPANDRERALSEVVAAALGLAGVDVEADFFALGGDSIVAMRLVGRARAAGLRITPRQVFAERTVAGLALVATALDPAGSPAADGVGSFPLTPVMRWLSEVEGPIDGFNQSAVVQVPAGLGWAPLLAALQAVTDRHDLLRARLDRTGDWSIVVPPVSLRAADFTVRVDVAGFDERGLWDAVAEQARIAQAALDPDRGVMIRAAWLDQAQVVAERPGEHMHLLGDQRDLAGGHLDPPGRGLMHPAQQQVDRLPGLRGDPVAMLRGEPERANGRGAVDRGEQVVLLIGDRDPLPGVERHGPPRVPADGVRLHRNRDQRGHQETPVQHGHPGQRQDDGQHRPDELGQRAAGRPGDQLDAGQHEIGRAAPGGGQVDDVAEQRRGDQAGDGARDHQEHRAGQAAPQRPDQDLQLGAGPPAARGRQQRRSAHARTVSR